jgi:hypothetical protein
MRKKKLVRMRNEEGFAFIMALLATLVMVSLGILIFALTTRDIRSSIKSAGEKVCNDVAENGVFNLVFQSEQLRGNIAGFTNTTVIGNSSFIIQNPPAGDVNATAFKHRQAFPSQTLAVSGSGNNVVVDRINHKRITGTDSRYGCQSVVDIGVKYPHYGGMLPEYQ